MLPGLIPALSLPALENLSVPGMTNTSGADSWSGPISNQIGGVTLAAPGAVNSGSALVVSAIVVSTVLLIFTRKR